MQRNALILEINMVNHTEAANGELSFSEQWKLKDAANIIFETLLEHAKKLGEFEKRMEAYENTNGFETLSSARQMYVKGDFYGYIKNTIKELVSDFDALNGKYAQCNTQLKLFASTLEIAQKTKKVVEDEGVIQFKISTSEDDVLSTLKQMITQGDEIMLSVGKEQQKIIGKTEKVILRMRKQF